MVHVVNVEISSAFRTALIPDVAVLNVEPHLVAFRLEYLVLAVEVWSPGNTNVERRTKLAGYAAGVEYLWIVDLDDTGATVTTHRLRLGAYVPETVIKPGGLDTLVTSAPVPVGSDVVGLVGVAVEPVSGRRPGSRHAQTAQKGC